MKTLLSIKWTPTEKTVALFALFIFSAKMILSANLTASIGWTIAPDSFLSFLQLGYNEFTASAMTILFVLSFFLLNTELDNIRYQAIAFFGAAILTVWLTLNHVIEPNSYILSALLSLSIFFIAIENIFAPKLKIENTRFLFVFIFGLLHGASFGGKLLNTGLVADHQTMSTFFIFSAGLLLGLLSILVVLFLVIAKILSTKSFYKRGIVTPVSVLLVLYSVVTILRLVFMTN